MGRSPLARAAGLLCALALAASSFAQVADPSLLAEINRIRAVDNHAHVPKVVGEGERADEEFDALPCPPERDAVVFARALPTNPEFVAAWRSLYGYDHSDMSEAHVGELVEKKRRVRREQGDNYPAWVLDKLGIDVMLANRIAMGRGLDTARFRWVPYADALLFPLDNAGLKRANPNRAYFFAREEPLLRRYLSESRVARVPASLAEYLARVVTPTLERQRRGGAVAIKFEAAYLRALDFDDASQGAAARVYARHARGTEPGAADYKALQDFLFRYIAREAGRLGLAVHIHTGGGCGNFFSLRGSDPLLLEPALNDPALRKTAFVLVHGGEPFTQQTALLLGKPNVYADFSAQTFLFSPRVLSDTLRYWLTLYPDKVLFGTDLFPGSPEIDWEEFGWQTTTTARHALALALTGMVRDEEITRARAAEIARAVMRENALKLYGLGAK
ncbi:MAG: amidohydrolase family protein [Acidobacteria bacterium]|nr:amidohydrolase family protein [Acidobacteriota bacterium]MCA1632399.1 amidohydrolase family protein [Acidobacteriota bacterium]MCA1640741.1 amidohydrolase family protein [Acidobacteriota bacterium]